MSDENKRTIPNSMALYPKSLESCVYFSAIDMIYVACKVTKIVEQRFQGDEYGQKNFSSDDNEFWPAFPIRLKRQKPKVRPKVGKLGKYSTYMAKVTSSAAAKVRQKCGKSVAKVAKPKITPTDGLVWWFSSDWWL